MGTPGSNADTSTNGSIKAGGSAPKDKACPFCRQKFTSSSLGRHLDLYIKEKNPKPADGIHIVEEIRKLRGNITRRQPRTSTGRREDSTPAGTPGVHDRRSPDAESVRGDRSPSARREDLGPSNLNYVGKPRIFMPKASWEATGVMNNIPAARNGDSRSWNGEEGDVRRAEGRGRSVSRQVLAKSTFDQKQKMIEALDSAKAAELALRELLGSIRAAKHRIDRPDIFDYDPLTLDFPALCLHCLPPPPTLHSSTPIANAQSWSITPPDESQYKALRAHFSQIFRNHRNAIAVATTVPQDDLSYPLSTNDFLPHEDPLSIAASAEATASDLEARLTSHLHDVFTAWSNLPPQKRAEIWILEFARSVGRKSLEIEKMKKEKEILQQNNAHLKLQNDELSRLQQPREFRLVPPNTIPVNSDLMNEIAERGSNPNTRMMSVGYTIGDRSEHLDVMIERVINRWKGVVRQARGGSQTGLSAQRSFSGDSLLSPDKATHPNIVISPNLSNNSNTQPLSPNLPTASTVNSSHSSTVNNVEVEGRGVSVGSDADADADADADMEEDDPYDMAGLTHGHDPNGFGLMNGNVNANGLKNGTSHANVMEGIENAVQGYVRIGA